MVPYEDFMKHQEAAEKERRKYVKQPEVRELDMRPLMLKDNDGDVNIKERASHYDRALNIRFADAPVFTAVDEEVAGESDEEMQLYWDSDAEHGRDSPR